MFDAPLELHAVVVAVLVWPFVALGLHLLLTAAFGPREPEPEWAGVGWSSYYGGPGEEPGGPKPAAGPGAGPVPGAPAGGSGAS